MVDDMPKEIYTILFITCFSFIPIFFTMKLIRNLLIKSKYLINKWRNNDYIFEHQEYGYVEHWKLFIIGFLDSLKGLLIFFSGYQTPATLQPILTNVAIPFTFIVSYIIMRYKFKTSLFIGDLSAALIVIIGVIVSLIPTFIKISKGDLVGVSAIWPFIYVIGILPAALMNILLEKFTKNIKNIDYFDMNGWISIYQFITCCFFVWLNFIFPTDLHNFSDIGREFDNTFKCLLALDDEKCKMSLIDTCIFVTAYIGTYLSTSILLKMITSIFVSLINVCVTPTSSILFSIIGMDKFNVFTGLSLPIMFIGVIINIFVDYKRAKSNVTNENESKILLYHDNNNYYGAINNDND
jgi:drug/metabolite transporter (DMT)-like permease